MTQPQTLFLLCLLSAAALIATIGACVSPAPEQSHPMSSPPGLRGLLPFSRPVVAEGSLPPSAGVFCQLSTARRCSEIFPGRARPCLLAAERCPQDGTIQRVEAVPFDPDR